MRTWIDIDLDRLIANYRTACGMTEALVTCVVKSNAYGHGAVRVAQALEHAGCRSFAVSCAREAVELRQAGVSGELLIMGATEREMLPQAIACGAVLTVSSVEEILAAEEAAAALNRPVSCHIKMDTGFHRLGFDCAEEAAEAIARCAEKLHFVRLDGLFSHLGLITPKRDAMQYEQLMTMRDMLAGRGVCPQDIHLCDSIGLVRYPAWHMSRVRVGAMLYGVRPYHSEHLPFDCLETLAFRARVAQVRQVSKDEIVGYGDDQPLTRDSRIATVCVGYGDGYPRSLSNGRGQVAIRGKRAPVIGLVCMDQMMVDVTDIPDCAAGDTADLLGGGIPYGEFADWAHTNRNECLSILSRRPIRVYWQDGRRATVLDSLLDRREDF